MGTEQEFRGFVESLLSVLANPNPDARLAALRALVDAWAERDLEELRAKSQDLSRLHSSPNVPVDVGKLPPHVGKQLELFLQPALVDTLMEALVPFEYRAIARWLAEEASNMDAETRTRVEIIIELVPEAEELLPPDLFALMLPYSMTAGFPEFVAEFVDNERQQYRDPAVALLEEYRSRKEYLSKLAIMTALSRNGLIKRASDLTEEEKSHWRVPRVGPPFDNRDASYPSWHSSAPRQGGLFGKLARSLRKWTSGD